MQNNKQFLNWLGFCTIFLKFLALYGSIQVLLPFKKRPRKKTSMKERERTILQYDIQHWAKKLGHFYYIGTRYIISSMVLDKLRMMINYRSKGVQKLHSAVEVVVYMVWCENKEWRLLWNFEYYIFSSINKKNTSWTHLPTILL